jgi:hypothetical protein
MRVEVNKIICTKCLQSEKKIFKILLLKYGSYTFLIFQNHYSKSYAFNAWCQLSHYLVTLYL